MQSVRRSLVEITVCDRVFHQENLEDSAQVAGVYEPPLGNPQALIEIEFNEVAEAKALLPADLL